MAVERSSAVTFWCARPDRSSILLSLAVALLMACPYAGTAAFADQPEVAWTEDFATDPVAAGRFAVQPVEFAGRFTYDSGNTRLTAHYDTYQPTAWYMKPLGRTLGRFDDFEFSVTFSIDGDTFSAVGLGQIAWGLINSQTTGPNRAGCEGEGPNAFDCVTFDYFPGLEKPTIGPTIIHTDMGQPFWDSIEFDWAAETIIDATKGDEGILPDQTYTLHVAYQGFGQVATLTVRQGDRLLNINVDGAGGYGGTDGDPTTIQTHVITDAPFAVDAFALATWGIPCLPGPVIADVDFLRIEFFAPAFLQGDMNGDGFVDGRDIGPFLESLMASQADPWAIARGDFSGNGALDMADIQPFVDKLTQP
jgi:hypothetical protein